MTLCGRSAIFKFVSMMTLEFWKIRRKRIVASYKMTF